MLNEQDSIVFFSSLLRALFCTNKDNDVALTDHLLRMLRTRYTQLKTFLETLQFVADIRTCTNGDLSKDIKSVGFSKQTHAAASGIEYNMYTKNPVIVIQDQVRQTNKSDLVLSTPKMRLFVIQRTATWTAQHVWRRQNC